MAKRFTVPSVNWVELEKRVPIDQKTNYFSFKGKHDVYLRRVNSNPPEPPKIDWEEYKKLVPIQGLVDKLKSEYEKFKVPYPIDPLTAKVDEQWTQLQPEIKKFCLEQDQIIDKANKELARIKALPRFEDMTMEMFLDLYPGVAIDFVKKPTFWPHTPEEQLDYVPPETPVQIAERVEKEQKGKK